MKILSSILFTLMLVWNSEAVGVGDMAPDFTLNSLDGKTVSLSDYAGKVIYIFWFGNG
jgi:peroxiredoxin